MSALQVSAFGKLEQPPLPANVRLHGRTYHVICSADSAPRAWFVSDADYAVPDDTINTLKLSVNDILTIGQTLNRLNPLSRTYVQLSRLASDFRLKLEWTPINRSVSAVIEKATGGIPKERQVFVQ